MARTRSLLALATTAVLAAAFAPAVDDPTADGVDDVVAVAPDGGDRERLERFGSLLYAEIRAGRIDKLLLAGMAP